MERESFTYSRVESRPSSVAASELLQGSRLRNASADNLEVKTKVESGATLEAEQVMAGSVLRGTMAVGSSAVEYIRIARGREKTKNYWQCIERCSNSSICIVTGRDTLISACKPKRSSQSNIGSKKALPPNAAPDSIARSLGRSAEASVVSI